jgi:hypothetical protein
MFFFDVFNSLNTLERILDEEEQEKLEEEERRRYELERFRKL